MVVKKIEIRPKGTGDYGDVLYPKTSTDMVVDEETGRSVDNFLVPVGGIIMWSGTHANIPLGWNLCNGLNGTPDLRDRFILGATSEANIGETGGSHEVTLTESQMPSHKHSGSTSYTGSHSHTFGISGGGATTSTYVPDSINRGEYSPYDQTTDSAGSHSHSLNISSTGGDQPHENRPAFYKLAFIMKV